MSSNSTTVSDELRLFQISVNIYLVSALSLFGILGNILSIIVLGRDRSMRRTTRFLLQMLSVADAAYLVCCLFYQTLKSICDLTDWMPAIKSIWAYIEPLAWPCASIAQTSTVWLVVVVTADRYVAICRPLHAPQYSTVSRTRIAVIVVWSLSILYNVPRFFERAVGEQLDPATNATKTGALRTSFRENRIYVIVYKTGLFFVVRFLVPFSALAFFNTCLIRAIDKSRRRQDKTQDTRRQRKNHTLMLVIVVIVFVLCEIPDLLLRLWLAIKSLLPDVTYPLQPLRFVNVTSNMLLTVNSCINFAIYCLLGRQFKAILVRLVCRRGRRQRSRPLRQFITKRRRLRSALDVRRGTLETEEGQCSSSGTERDRISTIARETYALPFIRQTAWGGDKERALVHHHHRPHIEDLY